MSQGKEIDFTKIRQGDALPECRIKMDRKTYLAYNDLVKNINPLHSDKEFAKKLGFKDIVVAGVYTYSFIPKMIEEWAGPSAVIRNIEIKFQNPIYIDETIIQKATVTKKAEEDGSKYIECEFSVEDETGNLLTSANATIGFP